MAEGLCFARLAQFLSVMNKLHATARVSVCAYRAVRRTAVCVGCPVQLRRRPASRSLCCMTSRVCRRSRSAAALCNKSATPCSSTSSAVIDKRRRAGVARPGTPFPLLCRMASALETRAGSCPHWMPWPLAPGPLPSPPDLQTCRAAARVRARVPWPDVCVSVSGIFPLLLFA